jgi:hypothetical protein
MQSEISCNCRPSFRELARSSKVQSIVEETLQNSASPVRATLFDKTGGANWLVPWYQDLTICVDTRLDVPGYGCVDTGEVR